MYIYIYIIYIVYMYMYYIYSIGHSADFYGIVSTKIHSRGKSMDE